jgi:hypothetical protein
MPGSVSNSMSEMPSLLERYELKFVIPERLVGPISDFASVYCRPDRYSEQSPDGYYAVYSLYFDSPDFLFLRNRLEGVANRFNMRVRAYDKESGTPCFFEVKQKRDGIIRKYRTKVENENWECILVRADYGYGGVAEKEKADLFVRLACSHGALPKVLSSYRRKAWVSVVDDYARVTFDRDLQCQPEERCMLIPDPRRMNAYDNSALFDPECSIILELKCYAASVPLWMLDLIRYFDLCRCSFSKYVNSMSNIWEQWGYDHGDRTAAVQ